MHGLLIVSPQQNQLVHHVFPLRWSTYFVDCIQFVCLLHMIMCTFMYALMTFLNNFITAGAVFVGLRDFVDLSSFRVAFYSNTRLNVPWSVVIGMHMANDLFVGLLFTYDVICVFMYTFYPVLMTSYPCIHVNWSRKYPRS